MFERDLPAESGIGAGACRPLRQDLALGTLGRSPVHPPPCAQSPRNTTCTTAAHPLAFCLGAEFAQCSSSASPAPNSANEQRAYEEAHLDQSTAR